MPAQLKLEWPEGQLAKAFRILLLSVLRQICQSTTMGTAESTAVPSPPTRHLLMASGLRSGSHMASAHGRGLPVKSFNPSVMRNALDNASPSPIHAAFHSQIFLRQISDFGVDRFAVGPGRRINEMTAVMIAGATTTTTSKTATETVSLRYGKEMVGS